MVNKADRSQREHEGQRDTKSLTNAQRHCSHECGLAGGLAPPQYHTQMVLGCRVVDFHFVYFRKNFDESERKVLVTREKVEARTFSQKTRILHLFHLWRVFFEEALIYAWSLRRRWRAEAKHLLILHNTPTLLSR